MSFFIVFFFEGGGGGGAGVGRNGKSTTFGYQ